MKLLNISVARAIWLVPLPDLNPRGQPIRQEGLDKIGKKYAFQLVPAIAKAIEASQKNEAVHFTGGIFRSSAGKDFAVDLKIHNDGFIAETRSSTRDAEEFLADLFEWLPLGLQLSTSNISIRKKLVVSEMHVSSEHVLTTLNPKLSKIAKTLASLVPPGSPTSYEATSLAFSTDFKDGTPLVSFKLERQINMPFSEHRYYSSAPIHTDDHLELLESLEKILAG
jgi:hypothetical protein